MGHALGQLIRYCKWRHKCDTAKSCVYKPSRPCPYFLWWRGRRSMCPRDDRGCIMHGPTGNFGPDPVMALIQVLKTGYIPEGLWKGISDRPRPWMFEPPQTAIEYARTRSNRNFTIHEIPEKSFYNVLASGHAILVSIRIGSEELAKSPGKIGPYSVDVVKRFQEPWIGGHSIVIVGAIVDPKGRMYFALQNSWGSDWVVGFISREDLKTRMSVQTGRTLTFSFSQNEKVD